MYYYSAFGLNIESGVDLEKLIAVEKLQSDVALHYQKTDAIIESPIINKKNFQANDYSFTYRLGEMSFYFNFLQRKLIFYFSNKQQFEQYLYGPVFALMAAYFKKLPLHASGVVINDKTILIAGNSGSGKSTFLYHLLQNYYARFFSDDLVVVEKNGSILKAFPSFAEIKLWLDAVERFNTVVIKPVHPDIKKYFVDVKDFFVNKPQIPQVVFILKTSLNSKLSVEKVTGVNKYLCLSKNIYRKNHIEGLFKQTVFEQLSALANQTKVYTISRPAAVEEKQWNEFVGNCLKQVL